MGGLQPGRFAMFSSLMGSATIALQVQRIIIAPTKKGIKDGDVDGFDNNALAFIKFIHWTGVQHVFSDHGSNSWIGNKEIITVDVKAH